MKCVIDMMCPGAALAPQAVGLRGFRFQLVMADRMNILALFKHFLPADHFSFDASCMS